MVQLALQLIPAVITGFLVYLLYILSTTLKYTGMQGCCDLRWLLTQTPAFNAFLAFAVQAVMAVITVLYSLKHVSNHIIMSFDIICILSLLMLILYHTLKEHGNPLVKQG